MFRVPRRETLNSNKRRTLADRDVFESDLNWDQIDQVEKILEQSSLSTKFQPKVCESLLQTLIWRLRVYTRVGHQTSKEANDFLRCDVSVFK